ncbi:phage integrase family protein [Burkholderia pseudomallei]|uniref:tyrosine-type recombinase/integrase n=1 Tax=Burkholderia pseudomallei TaxID=28450 RepID=UPI0005E5E26A|nr:site-specific integrase [Burkholderia pseudomallei]OMT98391.1 hypothetical protein AQ767_20375 [Burkholderia pseudomallei]CFK64760.1 phage integrase family protein [Burkholderia pseudomallei]CPF87931.1 phage integrase family protein [Burkholderia pseudomallei]CPG42524.1 phage integrase family protein [Burkholderia pseudomallei]
MKLEAGVQVVTTKGKSGTSVSYRVRIRNKMISVDKVFATLDEANDYARYVRTRDYQVQVEREKERETAIARSVAELFTNPTLRHVLQAFSRTRTSLSSYKTDRTKLLTSIPDTEIVFSADSASNEKRLFTERFLGVRIAGDDGENAKFGDLKMSQINSDVIELYIRARQDKGIARATIKKELGLLAICFDTVPLTYKNLAEQYRINPARLSNTRRKVLMPTVVIPDPIRISTEDEALILQKLQKFRNPAMLDIVLLSLSTGMRRGEILSLVWGQVNLDGKTIRLLNTQTKARKSRLVPITDVAKDCLIRCLRRYENEQAKEQPDEEFVLDPTRRIFSYTPDGFKSNFQRLQRWVGIDGLKFHLMRHEFISRLNESQNLNIHQLSKISGITDTEYLQQRIVEPANQKKAVNAILEGKATTEDVMKIVGHEDTKINSIYTHIDPDLLIKGIFQHSKDMSKDELREKLRIVQELQSNLMGKLLKD